MSDTLCKRENSPLFSDDVKHARIKNVCWATPFMLFNLKILVGPFKILCILTLMMCFFYFACYRTPIIPSARICIQATITARLWHHGQDNQAPGQLLWDGNPQTGGLPLWHRHQAWEMPQEGQSVCPCVCSVGSPWQLISSWNVEHIVVICFSFIVFLVKLWSTWSSTLKHRSLVIESQCMTGGRISTLPCPCPSAETRLLFSG